MEMKGEARIAGNRQHRRCASLFFFWNRTFYQCCNLAKNDYGILQSGYYRSADSRCCHRRGPWCLGRCEPHGRVRKRQPRRKCSCMIEKHQQNRQRQPPYRYSEQKGLVEMLTAVCYTKYDLSSGELAWKSPIRRFAYQKYFSRNFLFFCKIFSRIHSTWVRQERTVM